MTKPVRANIKLRYYLVSAAIAALATGAHAQQAEPAQPAAAAPAAKPSTTVTEVVVTGQRAALKSAIQTKKDAEVILDSVSADDAGKYPDNSVTEVLQRVAGVNITRIQTGSVGSENFLAEGTGITIRGLDSVVSQLNGRDSFSSVNGRGLAWEDIPPELMQGVDVYKSAEPDIPEGGLGGVINLRTRQPFDFKGATVQGALDANYADYAGQGHLGGNLLVSDRWQTPVGEFGLLVNAAYSDLSTKADGVQVQPYFAQVYNPTISSATLSTGNSDGERLPNLSDPGSKQVFVPYGVDFSERVDDRKRTGLYLAGEYRPNDQLLLGLTVFSSEYQLTSFQHLLMVDDSSDSVIPAGATATFNSAGLLTSTTALGGYSYAQTGSATAGGTGGGHGGQWGYVNNPYDFQSVLQNGVNRTTDISFTGDWKPSSRFDVKFAYQHVMSSAEENDHYAYDYAFLPQVGLKLSSYGSSALPVMTFPSGFDLSNAANYGYLATMDHMTNNHGTEDAVYADALYRLSDEGLIRAIKFGVKFTSRDEDDQQTPYNYQALSPYYGSAPYNMLAGSPASNPAYNSLVPLSGWFNGQMGLPAAAYFPSLTELNTNFGTLHAQLGSGVNVNQKAVTYLPDDTSTITERTATAYVMASFRSDDNPIVPFRGNVGVRFVYADDKASGNLIVPASLGTYYTGVTYPQALNYGPSSINFTNPQTGFASSGGHSQFNALPSLNIQFLPTPQLHVRFAASEGLDRPSFQQMSPQGTLGGTYAGTYTQNFITSVLGDPNLKPETALQLDTSIEYYFKKGGQVHFALFYKSINNYIGTKAQPASYTIPTAVAAGGYLPPTPTAPNTASITPCPSYPVTVGESCPQTVTAQVQSYFNESTAATIAGVELGIQKYADFLPHPFNGFGIDANYTFIDSHQPGAMAYDMLGNKINGLPVTGLSKNTINFGVMFDNGPLSARLAYNWRDSFLVTTTAYQTSGTYENLSNVPDTTNAASVNQYGQPIYYALPVFQYPTGQLDGNLTYRLGGPITLVLQGSNLTKTVTRLYMGAGDERVNRSWYTADRRYSASIRFAF